MEIICSIIKDELKNGAVGEGSVRSFDWKGKGCIIIYGLKSIELVEYVRV